MENIKLLEHAWNVENVIYVLAFLQPLSQAEKNGVKYLNNSH